MIILAEREVEIVTAWLWKALHAEVTSLVLILGLREKHLMVFIGERYGQISIWYTLLYPFCCKNVYQLRYSGFNNAAECEVNRHKIIKRKELLLTHLNQFWDTFWTNNIYLYKKVYFSSTNYLSVISNCVIVHKFSLCWGFSVLALFIFLRQFFFRVWLSFQFT